MHPPNSIWINIDNVCNIHLTNFEDQLIIEFNRLLFDNNYNYIYIDGLMLIVGVNWNLAKILGRFRQRYNLYVDSLYYNGRKVSTNLNKTLRELRVPFNARLQSF